MTISDYNCSEQGSWKLWTSPTGTLQEQVGCEKNRKNNSYFPLYWLFNRDPYNGLLQFSYNWVGFHPLYTRNNHGFCSLLVDKTDETTSRRFSCRILSRKSFLTGHRKPRVIH